MCQAKWGYAVQSAEHAGRINHYCYCYQHPLFLTCLCVYKMIHAIFIIAFTFGTITEFHTRAVFICASADCTLVSSLYHFHFLGGLLEFLGAFLLLKTGRTCKGHPAKEYAGKIAPSTTPSIKYHLITPSLVW